MSLSLTAKKRIDMLAPVSLAAVIAFVTLRSKKEIKFVVVASIIGLVVGYIITSQVTKAFYMKGPAPVPTGAGAENYDPKALVDAIKNDIYCKVCLRNHDIYTTLLSLNDAEFITCYNYWTTQYYSLDNETLAIAIAGENTFSWLDNSFLQQQKALAARFASLKLQ